MLERKVFLVKSDFAIWKAAATELNRYAINGVLWQTNQGTERFVATNGQALFMIDWEKQEDDAPSIDVILDACGLRKIHGALRKGEYVNRVTIDKGAVTFHTRDPKRSENREFKVDLVEGNYPRYLDVIPNSIELAACTLGAGLLANIVSIFPPERTIEFQTQANKPTLVKSEGAVQGLGDCELSRKYTAAIMPVAIRR